MQTRRHRQIRKAINKMVDSRYAKHGLITWEELLKEIKDAEDSYNKFIINKTKTGD